MKNTIGYLLRLPKAFQYTTLMIILQVSFAHSADFGSGVVKAIEEALRERPTVEVKAIITLENPKKLAWQSELLAVRVNGTLLENSGPIYRYRGLRDETARVIWLQLLLQKAGQASKIIEVKKELGLKNFGPKILVKIRVDYELQQVIVLEP